VTADLNQVTTVHKGRASDGRIHTKGKEWHNLLGGRNMPKGSVAKSGCAASTLPVANSEWGALPQMSIILYTSSLRITLQSISMHFSLLTFYSATHKHVSVS